MGDPAGIGPELLEEMLRQYDGNESLSLRPIRRPFSGPMGQPSSESGQAALDCIEEAVSLAVSGDVDGVVTAPISKTALQLAGSTATDHTTLLRDLASVSHTSMAFFSDPLKVVLATVHVPLRSVPDLLSESLLSQTIAHAQTFCQWQGIHDPRLAMAGLNPHAGEGGLMGREELEWLHSFCESKREEGLSLSNPLPPDTVFRQAVQGDYDCVIALYHDQGLIPVKLLAFESAVNVTVGLPFIRTSPDHGTAYDIVGKGLADPSSMKAAVDAAAQFAHHAR